MKTSTVASTCLLALTIGLLTFVSTTATGQLRGYSRENQYAESDPQKDSISASIAMNPTRFTLGQAPLVALTLKNISSGVINDETDLDYLPHLEGKKGEPLKTFYHRRRRHEPGLPELVLGPTVSLGIAPGESTIKEMDLTKYYDLSAPGKYFVYVEIRDQSGRLLRTNTVEFEIVKRPRNSVRHSFNNPTQLFALSPLTH